MSQAIVNENQNISYTNLDFSSIYTETLDLVKKLTNKWDPSISNESDPGVILLKLSALIADKCNYNIDKSILEAFPLSVTQDSNARQLYNQLGYYMDWYESATVPVTLTWINDDTEQESATYSIPKFTHICNDDSSIIYSIIGVEGTDNNLVVSNIPIGTDGKSVIAYAMEGTAVQYQYINGESVITAQMVDPNSHRIYFSTGNRLIPQNGIFIKNTNQDNYASWKRVNNLYEQNFQDLRYMFGYDSTANACYLEFPDNYAELFGNGIEISYLVWSTESDSSVKTQELNKFVTSFYPVDNTSVIIDNETVKVTNNLSALGHKDKESIDEAYTNYSRTVGTFKTLVTLRDYLNFIRDNDLGICSNAFVCDRTNDIQTVYKIISKQNNLDTLLVKVEQIIDKTPLESTFSYKFIKTSDISVVAGKSYYIISNNNTITPVTSPTGSPIAQGWYEQESIAPSQKDALDAFSIKFFLLKTAIALTTNSAYAQTFEMMQNSADIDALLENTAHLEHIYEDILPFGENMYKLSSDSAVLPNKSYFTYDAENEIYTLLTNPTGIPANNYYEIDIEATLPHTVFFKNTYPVTLNVSTYEIWDETKQQEISANIIQALYKNTNSNQIEFGDSISLDYLTQIVKNSDDRIKYVSFEPLTYTTHAIYYDKTKKSFIDLTLDTAIDTMHPTNYRDDKALKIAQIKKDIVTRSILAGTTQLLIPDDAFQYHLNQEYLDYIDNVRSLTSEALIDIANASLSTYLIDETNTNVVRKIYTLKDNETLNLYRPEIQQVQPFGNGVHYEYFTYKSIEADESYQLSRGEYFIFYVPLYDETQTLNGYTVYSYTSALSDTTTSAGDTLLESAILHPTFAIPYQSNGSLLSNFARTRIIPYLESHPLEYSYKVSTYNIADITQITSNTKISSQSISGTNTITIELFQPLNIYASDKYKFYWVLNNPTYSSEDNLKTYTLFNEYNSATDKDYFAKNSYTLKSGEYLYYTNADQSNLAIIGPGNTIMRNCGVNSKEYNEITTSLYYAEYNNLIQQQGVEIKLNGTSPGANGFYQISGTPTEVLTPTNPYAECLYEYDGTIYTLSIDTSPISGKQYYDVEFTRVPLSEAFDPEGHYYVLLMHKQDGWYVQYSYEDELGQQIIGYNAESLENSNFNLVNCYTVSDDPEGTPVINPAASGYYEIITNDAGAEITDTYSFDRIDYPSSLSATSHQRFSKLYESENTLLTRRLLSSNAKYEYIEVDKPSTYFTVNLSTLSGTNPNQLGLLNPIYKSYYTSSGTPVANVTMFSNPAKENFFEKNAQGVLVSSTETSPVIEKIVKSSEVNLFKEIENITYSTPYSINYFYRANSGDTNYYYASNKQEAYLKASEFNNVIQAATDYTPLERLYIIYSRIKPESYPEQATTTLINDINNNYWQSYWTFNMPNTWAIFDFESDNSGDFVKFSLEQIYEASGITSVFPADIDTYSSSTTTTHFYISRTEAIAAGLLDDAEEVSRYKKKESPSISLDYDYKLVNLFKHATSNIDIIKLMDKCTVEVFYLPKLYQFYDLVSFTYKNYYTPTQYFNPDFGTIPAWTCYAVDNDSLYDSPIGTLNSSEQSYWAYIQTNTSLSIVKNNMEWSFSAGDQVMFEAPESTVSEVDWPVFTNDETILDLNQYKVYYQRKNANLESLPALTVESYKWRGYSNLLLNTSSNNGQKLVSNQHIEVYSDDEEPTYVYGTDEGIWFQLKYPISNKAGDFINVSSINATTNETIPNEIYIFKSLPNVEGRYTYTNNDYRTEIYFNKINSNDYPSYQVKLPMSKLNGKYIFPLNLRDNTTISAQYHQYFLDNNTPVNICWTAVANAQASGNLKWTGQLVDLYSYIDTNRTAFGGTGRDYLCLNIHNINKDHVKIKLPSLITSNTTGYGIDKSPKALGWKEYNEAGELVTTENTNKGANLLIQVTTSELENANPKALGWYKLNLTNYELATETSAQQGVTYYKDPDFYVEAEDVVSEIIFSIPSTFTEPITFVIDDIYKYIDNPAFGNDFELVRNKVKQLDIDEEYNYAYVPANNDIIKNPLVAKSFWDTNHIFNKFTIAQLDFTDIEDNIKYITTK